MKGTTSVTGTDENEKNWYCVCTYSDYHKDYEFRQYGVTLSWIRVSSFNTYMTSVATSKSKLSNLSQLHSSCRVGDIVQLADKISGSPYHSIIISKKDTTSYFCGHSNSRTDAKIGDYLDASVDDFILFHFS